MASGIELAKAYVQIIPSADGIKGKLTGILGGEASEAGDAAGKTAGNSLASTIKGAIAAAGIGTVLKNSIMEGADLQQSLGGIETLFKDSSDKVIESAKNAYKTAGMSANEYMETVTGFSASLLQGLAGDTGKAADVADMALTDMSDNANKMGTAMELIQSAYQGFAKQNYTMLDNLKLGYGGTKTEMQRLLTDAQKLTGVKYDISNLSDVYEAIHVIQDEMGITGTTAKEAASTFSGSFTSMKSAWNNLLGELALGEEIGPSLSALGETVGTFLVSNFIPMIRNILSALPEVFKSAFKASMNGVDFIADNAGVFVQNGISLIEKIVSGIISARSYLIRAAESIVTELGNMLISTDWLAVATDVINRIGKNLGTAAEEILGMDSTIIDSLTVSITSNMPIIFETVSNAFIELWDICNEIWSTIGQPVWDAIMSTIQYVAENWGSISGTIATCFQMVCDFWNTAWMSIGKPVWDMISMVISSLTELFKENMTKIIGAFQNAISGIKDTWDNHLKPVFEAIGHFLTDIVKPVFERVFEGIILPLVKVVFETIGAFWLEILKPAFDGICDFLTNIFSGNWKAAWQGITKTFETVFGGIVNVAKKPINAVIGLVNDMIDAINSVSFDIPDWVPGIGGETFGFDIPNIPMLAKGGILQKGQVGLLEGSGAEAVVPLEQNTRWINEVANRFNGVSGSEAIELLRAILAELKQLNSELLEKLIAALEAMRFEIDRREFARLVKEV